MGRVSYYMCAVLADESACGTEVDVDRMGEEVFFFRHLRGGCFFYIKAMEIHSFV